jgi:hypothetical protein
MHRRNQVRLNWQALWNVLIAIAVASLVGILIDRIYSFESGSKSAFTASLRMPLFYWVNVSSLLSNPTF